MKTAVPPVLDVRRVSKLYRKGAREIRALRDVSLELPASNAVAIMGPSGSGKTTLLNMLAGLDRPTEGEIYVAGQRLADLDADTLTIFRRRHIGFVFQFFNLLPTMSARENVALPMLAERLPASTVDDRVDEMLEAVGIGARAEHRPSELSGGEQQRVAIARALTMRPALLLADEPTGNLDSTTGDEILALLRGTVERLGLSIVMATHSHAAAAAMDRVLIIRDGTLVEGIGSEPAKASGTRLQVVRPQHDD